MKEFIPGIILSLIGLVLLLLVDSQIYGGVMNLNMMILCLALHVFLLRLFLVDRRWVMYSIFITVFPILLFFSIPDLTQQQAMDKAVALHQIEIKETSKVLTNGIDDWNPFNSYNAYHFKGTAGEEEMSVIVIPDSGRVFVIDE
ncbi:MAG TPA: hypothetical protein VK947_07860 [Planococcus sp. (in: firmicutes)]|nr:hypothetical protein [Planococcus sp. (in: firmicutes)]